MHIIEHEAIKEESGDCGAIWRAQTNEKSRETEVHIIEHKIIEEESGDCGAIWRAQNI